MNKVIENIELLKKLQPYLWETEYYLDTYGADIGEFIVRKCDEITPDVCREMYKTLTLEEAMDLLPSDIRFKKEEKDRYCIQNISETMFGKTLLEAIEKMLEYLIDNNLL